MVNNNNNPCVYLDIVSDVNDNGEFIHANTIFASNNTTFNGSEVWTGYGQEPILLKANTINIAGRITNVFNNGVINLEISEHEQVQGNVTVQRVINGKLSKKWSMVKTDNNKYTLDLATINPISLGAVEKEGMQFVVRYSVVINNQNILNENKNVIEFYNGDVMETFDSAYINKLSFNNVVDRIYILTRFYNYVNKNDNEIQEDVLIEQQHVYIDLTEPKMKLKDTPDHADYNYWCYTDVCNTTIAENLDYLRVDFGKNANFDFYNEIGGTEKGDIGYLNYLKADDEYINNNIGARFLLEFTYRLPVATKGGFYIKVVMSNNNFQTNYIFRDSTNKDWQTIQVPYTLKNKNENNKFAVYVRGVCNKGKGEDLNNMVLDIQDIHLLEVQ